jgi:hypothetical protein
MDLAYSTNGGKTGRKKTTEKIKTWMEDNINMVPVVLGWSGVD